MVTNLFSLNSKVEIEEEKPYAGAHQSLPSFVVKSAENGGESNGEKKDSEKVSLKD